MVSSDRIRIGRREAIALLGFLCGIGSAAALALITTTPVRAAVGLA